MSKSVQNSEKNIDSTGTNKTNDSCNFNENVTFYSSEYVTKSQKEFKAQANINPPFRCSICNYMVCTKAGFKNHMKSHTKKNEILAKLSKRRTSDSDNSMNKESSRSNKLRVTKCRLCDFIGTNKAEYYSHLKENHAQSGKLLQCDYQLKGIRCNFVTEYKHHLEFHLRNHYGSKPFKCNQCNYRCVNKSMLKSHMRSHSNIYQFRCDRCSYAAKHGHSLKVHLRKCSYTSCLELNKDGTKNNNVALDTNSRKIGLTMRERKYLKYSEVSSSPTPPLTNSPLGTLLSPPPFWKNQTVGNYSGRNRPTSPNLNSSNYLKSLLSQFKKSEKCFMRCYYCDFVSDGEEVFQKHLIAHAATQLTESHYTKSDTRSQFQTNNSNIINKLTALNITCFRQNAPIFETNNSDEGLDTKTSTHDDISNPKTYLSMNDIIENQSRIGSQFTNNCIALLHDNNSYEPDLKIYETEHDGVTPLDLSFKSPARRTDKKLECNTETKTVENIHNGISV